MKKKVVLNCLALMLILSFLPMTLLAEETKVTSTETSKAIEQQIPNLIVTAKNGSMPKMISITAASLKDQKLLLRRTVDLKNWITVGDERSVQPNESVLWDNVAVADVDGSPYTYQVVALATTGDKSLATNVVANKNGGYDTLASTADVVAKKPVVETPTVAPETDKAVDKPTDAKAEVDKKTTKPTVVAPAKVTSKPAVKAKPAITSRSSKRVPKTGGSDAALYLGLMVCGGYALLLTRQRKQ